MKGVTLESVGGPAGPPGGGEVEWRAVSRVLRSQGSRLRHLVQSSSACFAADVTSTLFPSACRTCFGPLLHAGRVPLCDRCVGAVVAQTATLCRVCGEAMGMESDRFAGQFPAEGILCTPCRMVVPDFERAAAYGVYDNELREMIHLLKYERVRSVARPLGTMLAKVIASFEADAARTLQVIAVPLYPAKERQRGYNQAVLLADEALGLLRKQTPAWKLVPAHETLRRTRDTESQFALSPKGRRANLRGAFGVAEGAQVIGAEVLLIDDIYTTGATARECARVLRRAGARRVWVATVARAQAERVAMWDPPDPG